MELARRVQLVCDAVPPGCVVTYGQVAALCGHPRAARRVGQALGRGVSAMAHRVVNCRGVLSGAAAFPTPGLQRLLLEAEGVPFLPDGRVDLAACRWRPDEAAVAALDAAFAAAAV